MDRNTVRLHLAKCYQAELLQFCLRVTYLQSCITTNQRIYLQKPYMISWAYIQSSDKFDGIYFYSDKLANIKGLYKLLVRYINLNLRQLYVVTKSYLNPIELHACRSKNVILSLKEDSVHNDQGYRNQQFWFR